jgi:hypothetical protein
VKLFSSEKAIISSEWLFVLLMKSMLPVITVHLCVPFYSKNIQQQFLISYLHYYKRSVIFWDIKEFVLTVLTTNYTIFILENINKYIFLQWSCLA